MKLYILHQNQILVSKDKDVDIFDLFDVSAKALNAKYAEIEGVEKDAKTIEVGLKMWMHLFETIKELCLEVSDNDI